MAVLSATDFGWFTPVDLEYLFAALSKLPNPERVVLVGGQALSFWVDFFEIPTPATEAPYLTKDADFLGLRLEAMLLANELNADIKVATLDDIGTPNTAVLAFTGPSGQHLLIDFLSVLVGLNEAEIKRLAVPFQRQGRLLHILHPLMSLESRFHNLRLLSSKRDTNGIAQARFAVEVAKRYLDQQLSSMEFRNAYNAARRIANLALSPSGQFVWQEYGIDPLIAVDPDRFPRLEFKTKFWRSVIERIGRQRNRFS